MLASEAKSAAFLADLGRVCKTHGLILENRGGGPLVFAADANAINRRVHEIRMRHAAMLAKQDDPAVEVVEPVKPTEETPETAMSASPMDKPDED
ncbi:MAG: hypothetical protein AAF432_00380 [Planctomycetota bacterium]